ncbi:hypothetical protein K503DRAFT_33716 [Rhizopogon vinicolor AM-OR11-026]|uniref:Uncharacterized protein n=1 Tax=Rhizopogon vinicolor AM-OR11-026 TaxID=1314800 RepID=A0A1B7MH56_9AGAM|nr:hypothetical protein K503DRAFT_33716 [Rhizopogon vinicolor AM-OR11-026]
MFFITQIKSAMDTSNHTSKAVQILDEQRSSMSIRQFHSRLQPKRKRPHASAAHLHQILTVRCYMFDDDLPNFLHSFSLVLFFFFSLF